MKWCTYEFSQGTTEAVCAWLLNSFLHLNMWSLSDDSHVHDLTLMELKRNKRLLQLATQLLCPGHSSLILSLQPTKHTKIYVLLLVVD